MDAFRNALKTLYFCGPKFIWNNNNYHDGDANTQIYLE